MEAYAQTVSTPPTSEEDQQDTPLTPGTTEYLLPDVDPSLSMKKEAMEGEVKVEENQVEQGVGSRPACGKWRKCFASVGDRNIHVRRVHGCERYVCQCQVCDKLFTQKSSLNHHIKSVHQGEKPCPCPCAECGKYFSTRRILNRHIKSVHQGEKPHVCPVCEKGFSQTGTLHGHIRAVHRGEKPYTCTGCCKDFSEKGNLMLHIRTVHNGEKPHACPDCGKAFAHKQGVQRHMKVHSNG